MIFDSLAVDEPSTKGYFFIIITSFFFYLVLSIMNYVQSWIIALFFGCIKAQTMDTNIIFVCHLYWKER